MAIVFMLYSFTSTTSSVNNALAEIKKSGKSVSTEELFKGIFFAEGRVIDLIPTLKEFEIKNLTTNSKVIEEYKKMQNEVYVKISTEHPQLLKQFDEKIKSGNQVEVQEILSEVSQIVRDVINQITNCNKNIANLDLKDDFFKELNKSGINKNDVKAIAAFTKNYLAVKDAEGNSLQTSVPVVAVAAMGPVIVVAIVAAAVVIIYSAVAFWGSDDESSFANVNKANSLHNTQIVDEIANNLAKL